MFRAKFRAIFIGTGKFAVEQLRALSQETDVILVISSSPKPQGKARVIIPAPVYIEAQKLKISIITPEKIRLCVHDICQLEPDFVVVCDYGHILPKEILDIPRFPAINIHPSLLPRHRGPAPIVATILSGDMQAGVTIIQMDEKMDHGPILAQESILMSGEERADELEKTLSKISASLLKKTIRRILKNQINPIVQDDELATTHTFLHRSHGELNSKMKADYVLRLFRAYYPWPGVWINYFVRKKSLRIKFINIALCKNNIKLEPWNFYWLNDCLLFSFINGCICVNKLQVDGGTFLNSESFYRGYHDIIKTTQ